MNVFGYEVLPSGVPGTVCHHFTCTRCCATEQFDYREGFNAVSITVAYFQQWVKLNDYWFCPQCILRVPIDAVVINQSIVLSNKELTMLIGYAQELGLATVGEAISEIIRDRIVFDKSIKQYKKAQ